MNTRPESLTVVIDEYPYLKINGNGVFVNSMFQNIVDNHLTHIRLILAGSHIGMMREMLEEGNVLYGRFQAVIHLKEFSYRTAAAFYDYLTGEDLYL